MTALLAALPLAVILLAMGVLRLSAAKAGLIGLIVAVGLGVTLFDLSAAPVALLSGISAEAIFTTGTILWIIFPALALYEFQSRTGAIDHIRDALSHLTENRRLQAILIAWFFGLFIEGAAGFGTPVALAAPLLVGLGYPPVQAVVLALLGHAAGVSFGAIGTPTITQVELSGLDAVRLAGTVASLHAALGTMLLVATVRLAGEGPLTRTDWSWILRAALAFFIPFLLLAWLVGPELPSLGGGLFGAIAVIFIITRGKKSTGLDLRLLLRDLAPYLIILALVLTSRLAAPLKEMLLAPTLGWQWQGQFAGKFQPLYHPGTLLLLGLVAAALLTGRASALAPSLGAALRKLGGVALALLAMLALSRVMVHSGMIDRLAEAAAGLGSVWPLLAPALGVLGTFITGSATASNILFTELQLSTAAALGLGATKMVAAQGFGAAIGNVIAPHNIIAGSATVGLVGREGDILRKTFWIGIGYAFLGGVLIFALTLTG
ncbi:L-lactate permease [Celeribacter arenosi]|uniref:L-lactate permease n=1 Tax=Celeribacter arenosi TaxID=792649 RepID=A0ABP7JT27_9RHOB